MKEVDSLQGADNPLKDLRKNIRRKKVLAAAIIILFLAGAGGGYYYVTYADLETDLQNQLPARGGNQSGLQDVVTSSGTTSVGMVTEEFGIDYLDTELTIEEVCLSSGNEVEAGTPILKITEEDIRAASRELENLAQESSIAYRQGRIDYLLGKADAKAVYETALAENEYAEADYNAKLAEAARKMNDLEEKVADAKELYEEYNEGVHHNAYDTEYQVAEKKAAYEEHKLIYEEYLKRWNIEDAQVNHSGQNSSSGTSGNEQSGSITPGGGGSGSNNTDKQERLTALGLMEDEYREDLEVFEQAEEDSQKALKTAQAGLESVRTAYELAAMELEQAQIEYEKKAVSYQADYETAAADASTAQAAYQTSINRLEEDLETLQYEKEEAAENLEEFGTVIGDGYLYTSKRGTVVMVPIRKNTVLSGNTVVLAYSNPDTILVTAAVDQSSIAKLTVGEEAVAVFSEYGNFVGTVTSINPVSDSGSRTSVTYSVEITLEGDVSALSANKTAEVYFGIDLDTLTGLLGTAEEPPQKRAAEGGSADEK